MKRLRTSSSFVVALILLAGCERPGRYQVVVTPSFEGASNVYTPMIVVCDTRTGEVYTRALLARDFTHWDPVERSYTWDTLKIIKSHE
jgi:hypothetical protein